LLTRLLLIIELFSKLNQVLIQQTKHYLINPFAQTSDFMQQKRLMKNQQEAKVFFWHFLEPLAA
jgi:hypothetical protein